MSDFKKYRKAKTLYSLNYKGYALNRVLALNIWTLANSRLSFNWKSVAKLFCAYDFSDLTFDTSKHAILSTFGRYNRNDHRETYESVISMLDDNVARNIMIEPQRSVHFSFKTLLYVMANGFPVIRKMKGVSLCSKLALLSETVFWCNTINCLCTKDFTGVKKYLCFCDTLDLENLLTQHFKMKGIPTYSLTHGTHHIITKKPEPGMLVYENMETDHLLMWGQYSIDEFKKWGIANNRLYLAGYPKSKEIILMKPLKSIKRGIVLLSQHYFYSLNMKTLEILSNYTTTYEIIIKPHPSAVEYYKGFVEEHGMKMSDSNDTIEKCLDQERFDWCVAVNTAAYYDALMRGVRCLRFSDGSFDLQPGCDDIFGDSVQFESKMAEIINMSVNEYQIKVNSILKYAFGLGINNYRKIILNT